jgi:hypothetical protein
MINISLISQIIGATGVVASILYLAMQIRQNTKIAQSETLHALASRLIDRLLMVATDTELAELIAKDWDGELSQPETMQLTYWITSVVIDLKDVHHQCQLGVIPYSFLLERTQVAKRGMFNTALGKQVWENAKTVCDTKFILWFEKAMATDNH